MIIITPISWCLILCSDLILLFKLCPSCYGYWDIFCELLELWLT